MTNLHTLQQQAQQAILRREIDRHQRQQPGWAGAAAVRRLIWRNALTGWPGLTVLAVTGLAVGVTLILLWPKNWLAATALSLVVLGGGLLGEAFWLGTCLRNEQRQQRALALLLGQQVAFDVAALRDRRLQAQLIRALQLWGLIQAAAREAPPGALGQQAAATASQTTHWLHSAYILAGHTDRLRLSAALGQKTAPVAAASLCEVMQTRLGQAYRQLDDTAAGLQTVHGQLLLLATRHGQQPRHTERLALDISEEIERLQDLSAAMAEVYRGL